MSYFGIGEVIKEFRTRKNIKQAQLCEGLCEPPTLCKIENGKQIPTKKLLDALVQRLKIPLSLNIPVTITEFKRSELEYEIKNHFAHDNYDIESLLKQYKSVGNSMDNFEEQFYLYASALYFRHIKKDNKLALCNLEMAIKKTFPDPVKFSV